MNVHGLHQVLLGENSGLTQLRADFSATREKRSVSISYASQQEVVG